MVCVAGIYVHFYLNWSRMVSYFDFSTKTQLTRKGQISHRIPVSSDNYIRRAFSAGTERAEQRQRHPRENVEHPVAA